MCCGYDIGGVGLVSGLWLGYQWWCRIGECVAARTLVVEYDFMVM